MTLPILYGNRESGHSYKVKLALTLLGIDHEYREVDVVNQSREQRRPDFRAASPYGEVPVLVEDRVVLAQSNAILLHLAKRYRPPWRGAESRPPGSVAVLGSESHRPLRAEPQAHFELGTGDPRASAVLVACPRRGGSRSPQQTGRHTPVHPRCACLDR